MKLSQALACTVLLAQTLLASEPSMTSVHHISVPDKYQNGRESSYASPSDYERFITEYERGWWTCWHAFFIDIDHNVTDAESLSAGGWGSEVDGYETGYREATTRITHYIQTFGKPAVRDFLKPLFPSDADLARMKREQLKLEHAHPLDGEPAAGSPSRHEQ